ncbi:MAG TPA: hypothetical protein VI815_02330 [Candidatus Nanoarchaeia archaeon]|nr:hypothetical protein [Candidatus Nanoarchaeia archaeon]
MPFTINAEKHLYSDAIEEYYHTIKPNIKAKFTHYDLSQLTDDPGNTTLHMVSINAGYDNLMSKQEVEGLKEYFNITFDDETMVWISQNNEDIFIISSIQ